MEAIACDVLVIGSGAAGLTTAITAHHFGADVMVVEKASTFGGTTARSGGWLWVPGNSLATRAGVDDPLDVAGSAGHEELDDPLGFGGVVEDA